MALAFFLSTFLCSRKAQAIGFDPGIIYSLAIYVVIFGIVGARLLYVINDWRYFSNHPWEVPLLHRGGLVYYGGYILALAGGALFLRSKKLPALGIGDLFSPYVALGHSIGRLGCLLNGCCYGTNVLFEKYLLLVNNQTKFPIQGAAAIGNLLIFIFLVKRFGKKSFDGEILALYMLLYSGMRFAAEFFRGDPVVVFGGLRISQWISFFVFGAGAVLYMTCKKNIKRQSVD